VVPKFPDWCRLTVECEKDMERRFQDKAQSPATYNHPPRHSCPINQRENRNYVPVDSTFVAEASFRV
jgi:hypothetical protein